MPKVSRVSVNSSTHAPILESPDPALDFGHSLTESLGALAGLTLPPAELLRIQQEYVSSACQLWNQALDGHPEGRSADSDRDGNLDRRFASQDWQKNPVAAFSAALYLLNTKTLQRMAEALQGDEKSKRRVQFVTQQWLDALAPSNFLALNPEAQRKAIESKGESLTQGVLNLLHDLQQGHVSQTDERVFEVGRNVASTEGAVIYQNHFFQLIEYKPLTPKVYETPLLIVPPCINKYYILDLKPQNSLVHYALTQGHRVFLISWVNPSQDLAKADWDDYIEQGVIQAIREVLAVTGQPTLNALGFCIGGTLLSCGLAVLAAKGEQLAKSLTLLTALLDFAQTGVLDIFVDEALVQMREMTIGLDSPTGGELLKGRELASTFSFLRPNDLVWNYVVGNYLKGESPPPFDLLYWNSDSTNLPGPMYCWYLRHTYLRNQLREPGALKVCGVPVDLHQLAMPAYIYGSKEDHIVPWEGAYASVHLLTGQTRFVLGASGHIAGVINPPAAKKRSYWVSEVAPRHQTAAAWLDAAKENPGSWWTDWSNWLAAQGGRLISAPKKFGGASRSVIEPAPGSYVNLRD